MLNRVLLGFLLVAIFSCTVVAMENDKKQKEDEKLCAIIEDLDLSDEDEKSGENNDEKQHQGASVFDVNDCLQPKVLTGKVTTITKTKGSPISIKIVPFNDEKDIMAVGTAQGTVELYFLSRLGDNACEDIAVVDVVKNHASVKQGVTSIHSAQGNFLVVFCDGTSYSIDLNAYIKFPNKDNSDQFSVIECEKIKISETESCCVAIDSKNCGAMFLLENEEIASPIIRYIPIKSPLTAVSGVVFGENKKQVLAAFGSSSGSIVFCRCDFENNCSEIVVEIVSDRNNELPVKKILIDSEEKIFQIVLEGDIVISPFIFPKELFGFLYQK